MRMRLHHELNHRMCAHEIKKRIRIVDFSGHWAWVVWKYRGSASTRASHQGRSRGSRVTWSKIGTLMQNPLYFHGNQAVTMATGTGTMVTSAWMVTMGEPKMAESKMAESKMADPKNLIFFLTFLLKRILKFWKRIWILDRKLVY